LIPTLFPTHSGKNGKFALQIIIIQPVELPDHRTANPGVGGSGPSWPTKIKTGDQSRKADPQSLFFISLNGYADIAGRSVAIDGGYLQGSVIEDKLSKNLQPAFRL